MKPAGIILAAGESSRMGRDKALLPFGDSTFLNHLISVFAPRVDPLIVVLGHHASEIVANLSPSHPVKIVINAQYKEGMLTSLQAGLGAVPDTAAAAMFTLVDHPAVAAETVDRLIEAFAPDCWPQAIPRYDDRRGHPVLLARSVAEEILALDAGKSAKEVIHKHHGETLFVDVNDPGVLRDIDLPADYDELIRERTP